MSRVNSIVMNQNYVRKALDNPRISRENRDAVKPCVISHQEKFTSLAENTDEQSRTSGRPR